MFQKKYNKANAFFAVILSCLILTISLLVVVKKQYILDQFSIWSYQPTSEIVNLVERAGMGDYGRFIYLASQPKLDGTQDFNTECSRIESTTSILGCYSNYKIYIYDVTDDQLDGIREVTAAHETLHAAYVRLDDRERINVNKLLETEYEKLKDNEAFTDLMDYYSKAEPGQRDNELHSLIGTQVADISPELEVHYNKYFSDRSKVVALNQQYGRVFKELEAQASEIKAQMDALSDNISLRVNQYNYDATILNGDITSFNQRAKDGSFSSQYEFSQERATLNSRVGELDSIRVGINSDIQKYNLLMNDYNSIASQSDKLNNSMNSTLAPAPSV